MRIAAATVAGLPLLCLLGAGAGAEASRMTAGLSSPLDESAHLDAVALPDGRAQLAGPSGAPLLACIDGVLSPLDGGVRIVGDGDDTGLVVTYTGLQDASTTARTERGATLGRLPVEVGTASSHPTSTVIIGVTVDGRAVDAAPLLRVSASQDDGTSAGDMVRPVLGATVTQEFGCTAFAAEPADARCPGAHFHSGIDLAAATGTPVQAAAGGTARVIADRSGYGLHVVVDHGDGLVTLYAHLDTALVATGDRLPAGGLIGLVGSTGNSTGPHLHFEVRRGGFAEDPRRDVALP